jgi:hypothetical protein
MRSEGFVTWLKLAGLLGHLGLVQARLFQNRDLKPGLPGAPLQFPQDSLNFLVRNHQVPLRIPQVNPSAHINQHYMRVKA